MAEEGTETEHRRPNRGSHLHNPYREIEAVFDRLHRGRGQESQGKRECDRAPAFSRCDQDGEQAGKAARHPEHVLDEEVPSPPGVAVAQVALVALGAVDALREGDTEENSGQDDQQHADQSDVGQHSSRFLEASDFSGTHAWMLPDRGRLEGEGYG